MVDVFWYGLVYLFGGFCYEVVCSIYFVVGDECVCVCCVGFGGWSEEWYGCVVVVFCVVDWCWYFEGRW